MQTRPSGNFRAQNYSIFTFNQRILKRSLIKGYATNRQSFLPGTRINPDDYGRNAGLELNFKNQSGTWNPWISLHLSGKPGFGTGNFRNAGVMYNGRHFDYILDYISITSDYFADMGFIPRLDNYDAVNDTTIHLGFEHLFTNLGYTIRPSGDHKINAHEFSINTQINNFNINSRLQWRYLPMSDLFIVYTDNYYSDPFMKNKNRGIVFKLNYWLTL